VEIIDITIDADAEELRADHWGIFRSGDRARREGKEQPCNREAGT
jgi:hypothetical protein